MLYEYIKSNYKEAEPIFFSDVHLNDVSKPALSQMFKSLCEEGRLIKYETGIYFMPKASKLKSNVGPNADIVVRYKFVGRRGALFGYYSGNALANRMGISTQVPRKVEITSNRMAARVREIEIGKRIFVIRHPVVSVTNENAGVLQLLELLKNLEIYMDVSYPEAQERIAEYIIRNGITRDDIDRYIRSFPVNVFRNYYEVRLDEVFA